MPSLGSVPHADDRIVSHPAYRKLLQDMIDTAIQSSDSSTAMEFIAASDGVALVRLVDPRRGAAPGRIHQDTLPGRLIRIIGKGATGAGDACSHPHGPNDIDLRHALNLISTSEGRWPLAGIRLRRSA